MGAIGCVADAGLGGADGESGGLDRGCDDRQSLQRVLSAFGNVHVQIRILPFLEVVLEHIGIDYPSTVGPFDVKLNLQQTQFNLGHAVDCHLSVFTSVGIFVLPISDHVPLTTIHGVRPIS